MFSGVHSRYKDKVSGREVILTNHSFEAMRDGFGHSEARPDTEKYLPQIRMAIEDSMFVTKSVSKPENTCHYACYVGGHAHKNMHMKVIVEQAWHGNLEIVTAYFTDEVNSRESVIWIRK